MSKYYVEWIDLTSDDKEVTKDTVNYKELDILYDYQSKGLIHINKEREIKE